MTRRGRFFDDTSSKGFPDFVLRGRSVGSHLVCQRRREGGRGWEEGAGNRREEGGGWERTGMGRGRGQKWEGGAGNRREEGGARGGWEKGKGCRKRGGVEGERERGEVDGDEEREGVE